MTANRVPPAARPYLPSRRGIVENLIAAACIAAVVWLWGRYSAAPGLWARAALVGGAVLAVWLLALLADAIRRLTSEDAGQGGVRAVAALSESPTFRSAVMEAVAASLADYSAPEIARELERVIEEAAEAGKFRPRPRRQEGATVGWYSATIGISGRHEAFPVPWEAFREDIRGRKLPGLGLSSILAISGQPVVVTLTISSMTEDRILRNVRLEVEDGQVRAFVMGNSADMSIAGPITVVESDADNPQDPPAKATLRLGNLDPGKPVVVHLLAETRSFGFDPNNFRWYLFEGEIELGSGLYERISAPPS